MHETVHRCCCLCVSHAYAEPHQEVIGNSGPHLLIPNSSQPNETKNIEFVGMPQKRGFWFPQKPLNCRQHLTQNGPRGMLHNPFNQVLVEILMLASGCRTPNPKQQRMWTPGDFPHISSPFYRPQLLAFFSRHIRFQILTYIALLWGVLTLAQQKGLLKTSRLVQFVDACPPGAGPVQKPRGLCC